MQLCTSPSCHGVFEIETYRLDSNSTPQPAKGSWDMGGWGNEKPKKVKPATRMQAAPATPVQVRGSGMASLRFEKD